MLFLMRTFLQYLSFFLIFLLYFPSLIPSLLLSFFFSFSRFFPLSFSYSLSFIFFVPMTIGLGYISLTKTVQKPYRSDQNTLYTHTLIPYCTFFTLPWSLCLVTYLIIFASLLILSVICTKSYVPSTTIDLMYFFL